MTTMFILLQNLKKKILRETAWCRKEVLELSCKIMKPHRKEEK